MKNIVPRVAAIHDISGFGRCALTVIMPVLSTMGMQVCPVPTAVLSTHTGGFSDFSFHDLTDTMTGYIDHWKGLGLKFDCIYSGFLGSEHQIDIVKDFIRDFKTRENQLLVVDPVMADDGELYETYTPAMKKKMAFLVQKADIITPNLTEAYFLLDENYVEEPMNENAMKNMLKRLSDMGPKIVVITGVSGEDGRNYNIGYDKVAGICWKVGYERIPISYPGTGDIFTSVLIGGLLMGDNLPMAIDRATQFVSLAVRITYGYRTAEREGVILEKVLGWLNNKLMHCSYEVIE